MKQTLSNSAHLTIRKDATKKDGTSAIILRLKLSGKKKDISLGEFCPQSCWDDSNGRVRKSWSDYDRINTILESKLTRAKAIIFDYKIKHRQLTHDDFSREFGLLNSDSFIVFVENEIQ